MTGIYYAAVEGDPLTSGDGSCVYSTKKVGTIADKSGRPRRMAFIGDHAYCPMCKSTGFITYGVNIRKGGRMLDLVNGGRDQAVGGDIVLCKCADSPRIIAVHGTSWSIIDWGGPKSAPVAEVPVQSLTYDEQFTVKDTAAKPLPGLRYRIRIDSDVVARGVTDSTGRTQRFSTVNPQRLSLDVVASEKA